MYMHIIRKLLQLIPSYSAIKTNCITQIVDMWSVSHCWKCTLLTLRISNGIRVRTFLPVSIFGERGGLLLVFRFQIDPRGKPIRLIFEIRRCTVVKFDDEQKKGLRILMLTKDGPWPSKYRSKYRIRLGSKATETMFKFFLQKNSLWTSRVHRM